MAISMEKYAMRGELAEADSESSLFREDNIVERLLCDGPKNTESKCCLSARKCGSQNESAGPSDEFLYLGKNISR
jgi:hypothetical protein